MSNLDAPTRSSLRDLLPFFAAILGPEAPFYRLALVYGIGIGLLSLATPVSVQMLINTIQTGLTTPLVVLTITLFILLLLAGLLNALRIHLMDLYGRQLYARMVSEIALRAVYALNPFFQDQRLGSLFNRYFDIIIVQKTVPYLLIGGFTILLQAVLGFILVALYHPLFLLFNLIVVFLVWLVVLFWSGRAVRSAVKLSHSKHRAASWLEGLGDSNGFFKSERHIAEALERTEEVTADYIARHAEHFRHHFAQSIALLVLYAAASAALLGLGGWLVIQDQLSLGQLVAAELVLSVAFYGVAQLGTYMAYFYDLCGAVDELSLFYDIEQESPRGGAAQIDGDCRLDFVEVIAEMQGNPVTLNFAIPSGARIMGVSEAHSGQRTLTSVLKRHVRPKGGYIAIGGIDINSVIPHVLRQHVIVLDRPNAIELTVREYLSLSAGSDAEDVTLDVLRTVGLESAMTQLSQGLDTRLAATGWPLTIAETMQLKLAASIIARPKILILSQLFDVMPTRILNAALDRLQRESGTTVIYFTDRYRELGFDSYLYLGKSSQKLHASLDALMDETGARYIEREPRPDESRGGPMPALS